MNLRTTAAVVPVLLLVAASACGPTGEAVETSRADPRPGPETMAAPPPPPLTYERHGLGRGGTLGNALDGAGLDGNQQAALLAAVQPVVDLRRLPADTGLTVARRPDGELAQVSLRADAAVFHRFVYDGDGFRTETIELPVQVELASAGGWVDSSVAQALAHSPHGVPLTASYADIFQWDVDLLVDPRPGDAVRAIYEVRRLGATPADLPPFGAAANAEGDFVGLGRILAASYEGRIASATAFWVAAPEGDGDFYDDRGRPLRKSFLKSPLNYRRISSGFSRARRHPITRTVVPHHGVDFAAAPGTPVVSTADGQVVSAGWEGALGRCVRVRHGSEYVTVYGHLRGFARGIRRGVEVEQNQVIGYVGSTGRATGPHLHYTMLLRGTPINPMTFENPPVEELAPELEPVLLAARRRFGPMLDSVDALPDGVEIAREPAEIR